MSSPRFLTVLLLCFATSARLEARPARYIGLELFELAGTAHLVVTGRIVHLDERTFDLAIETTIAGAAPLPRIRVERYQDDMCSQRWTAYEVGQRLLLFLAPPNEYHKQLYIMSAGGEGEMPLDGDDALLLGYEVPGFELVDDRVRRWRSTRVPLDELTAAVRGLRRCFRFEGDPRRLPRMEIIEARVAPTELKQYALSSKLARHLYEEVVTSDAWATAERGAGFRPALDGSSKVVALEAGHAAEIESLDDLEGEPTQRLFRPLCTFVGDVDGNGCEDLVLQVSVILEREVHQRLWILFLDEAGRLLKRPSMRPYPVQAVIGDGTSGFSVTLNERSGFGSAVAPLGDLDGDCVPDIAVGAPSWDGAAESSGGVWVLFLNADGTVKSAVELGGRLQRVGSGPREGEHFGAALACLGDIDGDGTTELAIGHSPVGWSGEPSIRLVSLGKEAEVSSVRTVEVEGASACGGKLAAIGDVDGNGVVDLAASSRSGASRPTVSVLRLDRSGAVIGTTHIPDDFAGFEHVTANGVEFARALGTPGDLDGDGVPELLIGCWKGFYTVFLDATGGVADVREIRLPGDQPASFGRSLACGNKLPDGRIPLAVGGGLAPWLQGAVWMLSLDRDGNVLPW